ncbi:MAG: MFS transporter [Spirochaetales bacterium]|nr:MFS transporter [Spirochaetales bacterium]
MKRLKKRLPRLTEGEKQLLPADTLRQGVDGIIDTLRNSVFLLVALQYFQLSDRWNSLISISLALGMLTGLFLTPFLEKRFSPRTILIVLSSLMAAGLLLPLVISGGEVYALSVTGAVFMSSLRIPFQTGYYSECYRSDRMARLMSLGTLSFILIATASSWIFGRLLDGNLASYRLILLISGLAVGINTVFLRRLPPGKEPVAKRQPFWKNLRLIWEEPRFGIASLSWMIMGFANLWSLPMRTVFLADPERGLGLEPLTVLLILGIIPGIVRLLSNFIWAHFYDKAPFVVVRIIMNTILGLGIFFFFVTTKLWIISFGAALIHLSLGGAPFIWNLWVTRLAPPGETRRYMSVHTFLCGIRGVAGPPLAFLFIQNHEIQQVGMISAALAVVAVLTLIPLLSPKLRF